MSDNFAAPTNDATTAPPREVTGSVKVVAIVAIVLGVLGVVGGFIGAGAILFQGAMQDAAIALAPPSAQDEAQAMFDATSQIMPIGAVVALLSLALSIFLIVAGVQAVSKGATKLLEIGTISSLVYIVLFELIYNVVFVQLVWVGPLQQEYNEAVAAATGTDAAALGLGNTLGMGFGIFLILVRAGFYAWGFATVRGFNTAVSDEF